MKLYGYWRSSAAYRVRIALNLKGLDWAHIGVDLVAGGGAHLRSGYAAINPQQLVPALQTGGQVLTQSLAIIEYLEEIYPEPPLLPPGASERARVRALALAIACDIHPLNNLRVQTYLDESQGLDDGARRDWYHHWMHAGFGGLEAMLAGHQDTGVFCHQDRPSLADCCLVPQVYNARRFDVDLSPYPTIQRIEQACLDRQAFQAARPEAQPDAATEKPLRQDAPLTKSIE